MAVSSSLLRVPIDVPNRSGHNLDHSNSFTGKTGTLYPVLCHELLPNDTISLGNALQVQFPPMVTDFYGKVDFVLEAFFVPNRLLWGGWQDFITHPTANPQYPEGAAVQAKPKIVPYFKVPDSIQGNYEIGPHDLLHYLDYGDRVLQSGGSGTLPGTGPSYRTSVLKAMAYHRIWDDWYRDSRIQAPVFYRPVSANTNAVPNYPGWLPYLSTDQSGEAYSVDITSSFEDGHRFTALRQRNWVKDYFTTASLLPQAGGASEVKFDLDVDEEAGAFSISTLRAANSLQMWLERNNIAGYRYSDQIYAQFGIYPADAIMDRPLYLGRNINTVYSRSVFSTVKQGDEIPLGTKGANSQVIGEGSLIDSFTASEHGFVMVLASLVPKPVYGSGADRSSYRTRVGDFAFPLLAGMGDQAILKRELTGHSADVGTFGYTDLYAEYKFINDKVHGLLRDGQTLDKFVLQRSFDSRGSVLGTQFLQIPQNYLDQVQAVDTSTAGYSYWSEIAFSFKKISTIPAYSQPTLANLEYAHKEYMSRGGKRL